MIGYRNAFCSLGNHKMARPVMRQLPCGTLDQQKCNTLRVREVTFSIDRLV